MALAGASDSLTAVSMALLPADPNEDVMLLLNLDKALEGPAWPRFVDKKAFMALCTLYLKLLREGKDSSSDEIHPSSVDRAQTEVYDHLPPPPNDFIRIKSLLGKLVVLKILRSDSSNENPREAMQLSFISNQLKALKRKYGCSIPLLLAGTFANELYITRMALELESKGLTVVSIFQSQFPIVEINRDILPIEKRKDDDGESAYVCYAPGDGDVLSFLLKNNKFVAMSKEKKFLFFLSGETCEPIIDIKILNYLETRGFDFCLEATHGYKAFSSCKDLDRAIVSLNGNLKLIDREKATIQAAPEEESKFLCWNTNNIWMRLEVLQDLSDRGLLNLEVIGKLKLFDTKVTAKIESRAASAVEFFKNPIVLVIPQTRKIDRNSQFPHLKKFDSLMNPAFSERLKLKILISVLAFYFLYHAILVFVTVILHYKCESEEARTWIEGVIWYMILLVYLYLLYKRRVRRVCVPLDPEDRKGEIKADSFQVALHGFARLVYVGLLKSATAHNWFHNRWAPLAICNFVALGLEVPGAYFIEKYVGVGFKEPVEVEV